MKPPHYDILLVYNSFRRHNRYLNIAKHLGTRMRIGIVSLGIDSPKTGKTEKKFYDQCLEWGVEEVSGKATCHTLILPRMSPQAMRDLRTWAQDHLTYQRVCAWTNGPFNGLLEIEEMYRLWGDFTIWAQDRKRFGLDQPDTLEFLTRVPLNIVEVGSPNRKYPIISDFETDYLVAYPSTVSIPNKDYRQLYWLLREIVRAIDTLPTDAVVYTKVHNVKDEGNYISDRGIFHNFHLPRPLFRILLKMLDTIFRIPMANRRLYDWLPTALLQRVNWLQNAYVFQNTRDLLNEFPGYGLEHFMNGIRKGLIAGYGTILWEALYQRIPVWNIDRLPIRDREIPFTLAHQSYRMEKWGDSFSSIGFDTIEESTRQADLIEYLERTCKTVDAAMSLADQNT